MIYDGGVAQLYFTYCKRWPTFEFLWRILNLQRVNPEQREVRGAHYFVSAMSFNQEPPPLPPTPSFIIPKSEAAVEDNADDKNGHKRTISVAIEASLLTPPPVPEPPTPTAQLYDLPELDMKQFTRSAKMTLPGINEDSKNGLGQEAGRRSSVVLAFKREENFVKKLLNLFPKPPETKPDANGWSDASYMLERRKKQESKDQLFRIILNFSRCDIVASDLAKLRQLLPRMDSQELKMHSYLGVITSRIMFSS